MTTLVESMFVIFLFGTSLVAPHPNKINPVLKEPLHCLFSLVGDGQCFYNERPE